MRASEKIQTNNSNGNGESGFTLVEVLVVISIIAILAGLSTYGLGVARESANTSAVSHEISQIKTAIASFAREWGDYPPTSIGFLKIKGGNKINEGNETLFACLQARKKNGPFHNDFDESNWTNTDADKLTAASLKKVKEQLDWTRPGDQLLEYTDIWGNPYIYIHNNDYGKTFTYQLPDGKLIKIKAGKSELGGFAAPDSFQLWSIGSDEKNDNGAPDSDDVCSWRS